MLHHRTIHRAVLLPIAILETLRDIEYRPEHGRGPRLRTPRLGILHRIVADAHDTHRGLQAAEHTGIHHHLAASRVPGDAQIALRHHIVVHRNNGAESDRLGRAQCQLLAQIMRAIAQHGPPLDLHRFILRGEGGRQRLAVEVLRQPRVILIGL